MDDLWCDRSMMTWIVNGRGYPGLTIAQGTNGQKPVCPQPLPRCPLIKHPSAMTIMGPICLSMVVLSFFADSIVLTTYIEPLNIYFVFFKKKKICLRLFFYFKKPDFCIIV